MNAFFEVIKREIKKIIKKPLILFIIFLLPLIACFIIAETFVSGAARDLPIAVLDEDNSTISRQITRMLDATPSCAVKYRINNISEGKKLLQSEDIYALFLIPKDFMRDIYREKSPKLIYYYNNQTILIGGVITKDVQTVIQTIMSTINVKTRMKKGLSKDVALSKINLIRIDEHVHSNPYMNYSYFLAYATFAHTFQVIITFLAIWSFGIEFKEGTTKEWLKVADNSILIGVFGKLSVYIVCFLFLMIITYGSYILFYQAPCNGNIPFILLGMLAFILAYQFIGLMFVAILSNLRFALSSGAFYTSLGMTFAGMTYPAIAMPVFGQFYSALLPIRPFSNLIVDQMMRGFAPKYDWIYIFWMLSLAFVGFLFLPLLKKHAQDEKLWYQL